MNKQVLYDSIDSIYDKYKEDPYMSERIETYIKNQLPCIIEGFQQDYETRQTRMKDLLVEKDKFINDFLLYHPYYYVSATNKYFYYDGIHYYEYTEDNILIKILTTITKEKTLLCWKQKTKLAIMKMIKENLLLKSIPETTTIQNVLSILYPTFFTSKTEAKYFLCILGDNINKKNTHLTHFLPNSCKVCIQELNYICLTVFGTQLTNTIKNKFSGHAYENCRFLKVNETIQNDLNLEILLQSAMDILCVACHYSIRYGDSDTYVSTYSHDKELNDYVFSLQRLTQDGVVTDFIESYIVFEKNTSQTHQYEISWKNMLYLWKHYLSVNNWPSVISINTCKQLLTSKLQDNYNATTDSFYGIRCEHLPIIQHFLTFWDSSVTTTETENCDTDMFEYEINEITFMFQKWCSQNHVNHQMMTDDKMIDLIQFYFPAIEIIQNKYIYNIACSIWNKHHDIALAIEHYKLETEDKTIKYKDNAYLFYCKFIVGVHKNREQIVSKLFFMRYVDELQQ